MKQPTNIKINYVVDAVTDIARTILWLIRDCVGSSIYLWLIVGVVMMGLVLV